MYSESTWPRVSLLARAFNKLSVHMNSTAMQKTSTSLRAPQAAADGKKPCASTAEEKIAAKAAKVRMWPTAQLGRAHVWNTVNKEYIVCPLLIETTTKHN